MVAMDVEELAAGAVEAVEGRLVDIDGRKSRRNTGRVRVHRRRKTRGGVIGAYEGTF